MTPANPLSKSKMESRAAKKADHGQGEKSSDTSNGRAAQESFMVQ